MVPMRSISILVLAISALLNACGGASKHDGGTAESGAGGSQAGTSAGGAPTGGTAGSSGGATSSYCAASPPKDGGACKPRPSSGTQFGFSSADCSWGDDPRPACRTRGVCANGAWSITAPGDSCSVAAKPPACADAPPKEGATCADPMLQCWYDNGSVCSCSSCQGGSQYPICRTISPPVWACVPPPDGCPNPPPQAGSPCTDAKLQCGTSCELPIRCENGAWQYGQAMCPICASPDTPIATPSGDRPIAELRVGDLVYSVDRGAIVPVPIARVGSTPVAHHQVLRITLGDSGVIEISPGHPLANGKPLSSLSPGAEMDDQHRVRSIELVPYMHDRTYDILPSSSTGTYFAAGVLLGTTLQPQSESGVPFRSRAQ